MSPSESMLEAKNNLTIKLSNLVNDFNNCKLKQQKHDEIIRKISEDKKKIIELKKGLSCEKEKIIKLKNEIEKEAIYCEITPNFETRSINRSKYNINLLEESILKTHEELQSKEMEHLKDLKDPTELENFSKKEKEINDKIVEAKKMLNKKQDDIDIYNEQKGNIENLFEWKYRYVEYAYKYNICKKC
jgi:myosin heavy subunit